MSIKDKLVSKGAEKAANMLFEGIGKVSGFSIDSRNKAIKLVVEFKDEIEPVSINIMEYEMLEESSRGYIIIHSLRTSREWMNVAFERFFKGKKMEIPDKYNWIMKQAL